MAKRVCYLVSWWVEGVPEGRIFQELDAKVVRCMKEVTLLRGVTLGPLLEQMTIDNLTDEERTRFELLKKG